jgi:transglutaminase-like putative cysteine protease
VLSAVVIGPALPGSHERPVLAWRKGNRPGGSSSRTAVSPLVDIRGRLVDQSATEAFTVGASEPSYWRLTSLDTFDGTIWKQNFSYKPVKKRLPGGVPAKAPVEQVVQRYRVESLASIWLPAAYRPERIDGVKASFDSDSGSLITDEDTTDGDEYQVSSTIPRPAGADLAQAPEALGEPDLQRYLQLPPVTPRLVALARTLTANAPTPYAKARALQDWLRKNFAYDLRPRLGGRNSGHDVRTLERFLFDVRRGYCEQFAGSYGVLARVVGLPTRVAVGFTQGELGTDNLYHVRGLNAHAWPEVWLQGYGWTYFEPTPGRGQPGMEDHTGVPASQAVPANPSTATTSPPTTAAPSEPSVRPATTEAPAPVGAPKPHRRFAPLHNPVVRMVLALLLLAGLWIGLVPAAAFLRRRRRRARAKAAAERVLVSWAEASEALAAAGAKRRPAETLHEYARRAPRVTRLGEAPARALLTLAGDTATVSYARAPVDPETAARAAAAADAVERALREGVPRLTRFRRAVDPRTLVSST